MAVSNGIHDDPGWPYNTIGEFTACADMIQLLMRFQCAACRDCLEWCWFPSGTLREKYEWGIVIHNTLKDLLWILLNITCPSEVIISKCVILVLYSFNSKNLRSFCDIFNDAKWYMWWIVIYRICVMLCHVSLCGAFLYARCFRLQQRSILLESAGRIIWNKGLHCGSLRRLIKWITWNA